MDIITVTVAITWRFFEIGEYGITGEEGDKGQRGDKGRSGVPGRILYKPVPQGKQYIRTKNL